MNTALCAASSTEIIIRLLMDTAQKRSKMFKILYHPRAIKFLEKSAEKDLQKIIKKIDLLLQNPLNEALNIKKLATTKGSYRIRIGKIRVVFEIFIEINTVYIDDIDFRGNIY